jgi:hypothetical protein
MYLRRIMNKPNIYIVGDCHAVRVLQHGRRNAISAEANVTIWGRAGLSCWHLDIDELRNEKHISSPLETEVCRELEITYDSVKDDGIIMPWIGYVDIRQFLPKYKNARVVVQKYVDSFIEAYPNSKIKFIEPLPQFTEMLMKYEGFNPYYSYEDRLEQSNDFIKELRAYCLSRGLPEPVPQQKIYDLVGVSEFTPDLAPKDRPHPVDALLDPYYSKIYNLFVQEGINASNLSVI